MKNILVSEEQLEILMKNLKEEHKQGSYMAKQQLFTIATLAHQMWQIMEEGDQLEDWMESKIAQSEQSIISVVKSYLYDEVVDKNGEVDDKGMDKLNFKDLVIGN
jgi:hypothetical protein